MTMAGHLPARAPRAPRAERPPRSLLTLCAAALAWAAPALALAQEAAQEGVKNLPPTPSYGGEMLKVLGVLCLILASMFAGLWLLRRFGRRAGLGVFGGSGLKVEGQLALGPKKQVFVVRFLNKRLVLGVTDTSINLLTETDAENETAEQDFAGSLEKARRTDHTS
ncbi:flagellar biosynthetic protein FliO [Desulfocurvus sp. DL9XJH121]